MTELHDRIQSSFARQTAMSTIGAELTHVAAGEVDIELPFRADLCQQHGFIHAGILTSIVDTACGYAAYTLMDPDTEVLTVEFKTNFMSPGAGQLFIAQGRIVRSGRTISVTRGDVYAIQPDARKKHIVTMQATMMCIR